MSLTTPSLHGGLSPAQACGLVVSFSLLIQTFLTAATYFYFTNELKQLAQLQEANSQSGLHCLTKEYLGAMMGNSDPSSTTEPIDSVCLQVKWHLQQLIKKELLTIYEDSSTRQGKRQNNVSGAREGFNQSAIQSVAAHLTINRQISPPFSRTLMPGSTLGWKIRYWESSRKGHSFQHNMDLLDGELIVSQPGYYYIYSQTYFRFQESEESSVSTLNGEKSKQSKQLVQYIYKVTSYPEPILLLKSAMTTCWSKDSEYGLYSIYQGGVFEFREKERIFVSVSNEKLVDMDKEASFFGAFRIG
ncbi:tumor necrosis factor ligand superfamily member 10 isoform X1 [Monodelphis domestica]|uniref:Tumor necrosis factor ligand superfamily member n=1 Tax=Monodelphis domestica TaxID=13616 RepID=A0A5F8H569_MONDO|nr:tumor necrosis factor ligand superfamily member 10 isoform X1 [Monodelphis domestica]